MRRCRCPASCRRRGTACGCPRDVVELADRQRRGVPGLAAVGADVDAAVVAVDDPVGVLRVDPESWWSPWCGPLTRVSVLPPSMRLEQRHLREVDDVGVLRMDGERREVPGPLLESALVRVDAVPGVAAVVAAEQAALLGLDQRVDALRSDGATARPILPQIALGQPLGSASCPWPRPPCRRSGGATSCVQVSPPSRETYRPLPGPPLVSLPRPCAAPATGRRRRCADCSGRSRRRRAGVGVLEQDALPRLAAVGGAIDAALGVGAEGLAEDGGEGDVGVLGMDDDRCRSGLPASRRVSRSCRRRWSGTGRCRPRRCRGCWPRRSRRRRRSGRTARRRWSRRSRWACRRRSASSGCRRRTTSTAPPAAVAA